MGVVEQPNEDDVLRRMLNTPPKPHDDIKPPKQAKRKKAAVSR
jgi:hypothetical protein